MKNIVFVVGNYKNGGVPMRSTNLANEFAKKGYKSTILVTKEIGDNVFFERHKNVSIVSLNEFAPQHSEDDAVQKILKKRKLYIRILKYLRYITRFFSKTDNKIASEIRGIRKSEDMSVFAALNPDSIYIPFGIGYLETTYYGTKGIKSKIIYAERTTPLTEFPTDKSESDRIIGLLKKTDKAVLQTQNSAQFYKKHLDNFCVINNPIKEGLPEKYNGIRRNCVTTFCRIAEEKNLPMLFDAFIKFHKIHPDYTLEIYGNTVEQSEEELKSEYLELVKKLNADEFIKIIPPRADVHAVVRDCAMFVSSSDFEGLSNSMIEAMAIGLPCICTDCLGGGAAEVIKNNENGILVPVKNSDELFKAMCRISDDKEFSEKLSINASEIKNDLSLTVIAEKWMTIINKLI